MRWILKNPITIWLIRSIRNQLLEYKNFYLKLGYLADITNCKFAKYNMIGESVGLSNVEIDNLSYVAKNTQIMNTTIGKFCSIGPDCRIGLGNHPTKDFVSTHPIFFSDSPPIGISFLKKSVFLESKRIEIGNDVWIGCNVIITDGVKISSGAIIAAGSIVTKDVPPYAIVGGVPAKVMKYRFQLDEISKLLNLQWWNIDLDQLRLDCSKFHDIKIFNLK